MEPSKKSSNFFSLDSDLNAYQDCFPPGDGDKEVHENLNDKNLIIFTPEVKDMIHADDDANALKE